MRTRLIRDGPAVGLKCALNLTVLIGNFQGGSTAAWMSDVSYFPDSNS